MNFRTRYEICSCCKGEGYRQDPMKSERSILECKYCNGTGKVLVYEPDFKIEIPCGDEELKREFEKETNKIEEAFFDAKAKIANFNKQK